MGRTRTKMFTPLLGGMAAPSCDDVAGGACCKVAQLMAVRQCTGRAHVLGVCVLVLLCLRVSLFEVFCGVGCCLSVLLLLAAKCCKAYVLSRGSAPQRCLLRFMDTNMICTVAEAPKVGIKLGTKVG